MRSWQVAVVVVVLIAGLGVTLVRRGSNASEHNAGAVPAVLRAASEPAPVVKGAATVDAIHGWGPNRSTDW